MATGEVVEIPVTEEHRGGLGLRLTTSRFMGGERNFDVTAYAARSVREGRSGNDWSWGFSARYPNDK